MLKLKLSNSLALNYRFIVVLLVFVIFNIIGLHYESVFQENSAQHIKAVGILEELKTSIYKQRHLISYLQIEYLKKGNSVEKRIIKLVHENNRSMHKLVNEVANFNASGRFGIPSIREIYFDSVWRVDEGFAHFSKLIDSYLITVRKISRANISKRDRYFYEIEKHGENLLNSLIPIQQELLKTRTQYFEYMSINDDLSRIITFLLALFVYISLYRPWKEQIDANTLESQHLKEVLSESELKGNIFSWDLNYATKELRQSKHLTSIFSLSDESEYAFLYDELSCFDSDDRDKFLLAIEKCVSKKENLEITVQVKTKNKRSYWLHYSAKRREEKDIIWISGTVQDVTALKVVNKRFDDLFNRIEMPLIIFGEGKIHDFNNSAKKFFGLDSDEEYKLLHPAIMFPLYQEDGRSSLEKLSQSIEDIGSEGIINDRWSFHTQDLGVISAKTRLFDINFNDSTLHLMIISPQRDAQELERRLVDAYRKAQYARRSKIEYIAQNSIVLQDFIDSLKKVKDHIYSGKDLSDNEKQNDSIVLDSIENKIRENGNKYISRSLEETYGLIIFDLKEMIENLEHRWNAISDGKHSIEVNLHFEKSYFWGDILKIKGLFIAVVENALYLSARGHIHLNLYHDTLKYDKEEIRAEVTCEDKHWPGDDWVNLTDNEKPNFGGEIVTPKRMLELVDFLDGDFEFHRFAPEGNDEGMIKFSFSVKSVHGRMFKGNNEVYFMMNNEEFFVPYNETAISSSDIWSHFGGDWDLIESAIKDFIEYYPQVIADIHIGLNLKDGDLIYNAASEFYGVLTHFPFFTSIDRVVLLQKYGENLKFYEAEKELNTLIQELADFAHILEKFLPSSKEHVA